MVDLFQYTNEELLNELLNRTTFRGIIISQRGDYKGIFEPHWRYDYNNIESDRLPGILNYFSDVLTRLKNTESEAEPD